MNTSNLCYLLIEKAHQMIKYKYLSLMLFLIQNLFSPSLMSQSSFLNGAKYYLNHQKINVQGWPEYHTYIDSIKLDSISNNREYFTYFHSDSQTNSKLFVENRRVYFKLFDTGYTMISDFNLNKNDSMPFYMIQGNEIKYYGKIKIDSVENTFIFGKQTKILYLRFNNYKYFNFAEHFGCLRSGIPYWRNFSIKSSVRCIGMCYQDSAFCWIENQGSDPGFIKREDGCVNLKNALKIENVELQSPSIYPNPVDRFIDIEFSNQIDEISIRNNIGIMVLQKSIKSYKKSIDVSFLMPGVYYLLIQSDGRQFVKKLYIIH